MTNEELAKALEKIQELESKCRQRTGEFIARSTTLFEEQARWNQRIEECLTSMKENLQSINQRLWRAAGALGAIILIGKVILDYFKI